MASLIPISVEISDYLNFLNDNIYLLKHKCSLKLYMLIRKAKINARKNGKTAFVMRIEGSTKVFKNQYETGRFTITLLLSEFLDYEKDDAEQIVNFLGFTLKEISDWIPVNATYDTDIIFGQSLNTNVNKVYFDVNGDIKCYENNGKIKCYIKSNLKDNLTVISDNKVIGIHKRIKDLQYFNGYPVYWKSETIDGNSYYTRPSCGLVSGTYLTLLDLYFKYLKCSFL